MLVIIQAPKVQDTFPARHTCCLRQASSPKLKNRKTTDRTTERYSVAVQPVTYTGLLSNQGEKSIHFFFITVPLRKKY